MSNPKKVLAVCVNWNGGSVLGATLKSLGQSRYARLEVVVVDSASTDNSLQEIPAAVRVLQMDRNRGYASALNVAIEQAIRPVQSDERPDYLLLLNNDILLEVDLISRLVDFAERTGSGIFGPKVLRRDDPRRLDAAWGNISWSHVLARYRGKGALDASRWNQTQRAQLLLGCALLVSRSVFETIGLFDERFFMYHEEVDFLFRAAQEGVPCYYCPFASVLHIGALGTRHQPLRKVFWLRRNTVLFFRKHHAGWLKWSYFSITLLGSLLFNIGTLRWRRLKAIVAGVWEGFRRPLNA